MMVAMADSAALTAALVAATRVVAFTGAGISTESGIPDFRSPGGIWTRYNPQDFTFERFVADPDLRRLSWRLRREQWSTRPVPNAAHRALAELEVDGRLLGIVTQNIDGLHQAAGSRRVVEIHGSGQHVHCIGRRPRGGMPEGCGWAAPADWAIAALDEGALDLVCPDCGGLVKAMTISFGQQLVPEVIAEAVALAERCDLLLTIGSSLQVYPAAGLPQIAVDRGAMVAIVNDEPTPLDGLAEVVVRGRAGAVLPPAVAGALRG
jgi:NAD-dependent deacetylase